jgi:hypothetical protein
VARLVLPVAGGIIGGIYGGPAGAQAGWMIGSLVAGVVDPMRMDGPKLGDLAVQTSRDGAPRPILFGTGSMTGNIVYRSEPRYFNVEVGGKGGPVQVEKHVALSFAIRFLDARANAVGALVRLWEDEKLVVDLRPGSTIRSQSAKFLEKVSIYLGTEDQLPDPTYEMDKGVGNAPAFRGTAYLFFNDIDLTQAGGRIAQYRAEWSSAGSTTSDEGGGWIAGPVAVNGALGGSQQYFQRADTLEDLPFAIPTLAPHGFSKICKTANGTLFLYSHVQMSVSFDRGATWTLCVNGGVASGDAYEVTWNGHYYYHKTRRSADGVTWVAMTGLPAGTTEVVGREFFNNDILAVTSPGAPPSSLYQSFDDGDNWELKLTYPSWSIGTPVSGHLIWEWPVDSGARSAFTDDGFDTVQDVAGANYEYRAFYSDEFQDAWLIKVFSDRLVYSGDKFATTEDTLYIATGATQDNSVAWGDHTWAALRSVAGSPHRHYINYNREGGKPGGWSPEIATPLYGNGGNIVWTGARLAAEVTPGTSTVEEVVTKLLAYTGFDTAKLEFDSVGAEVVDGYVVGGLYSCVEAIRPLQRTHFFDFVAYDGKLRAVKRGGPSVATIYDEECIDEEDGGPMRNRDRNDEYQEDELEFPKKLHLDYQNPEVGYASSKATVTRSSPDVRVTGELSVQCPESFDSERAHQIADVLLKMAWVDVKGEIRRKVPRKWAKLVPTNIITLVSRGRSMRLRIDDVERTDGISTLIMRHDRQSAYESTYEGIPLPAPLPPPIFAESPTVFALFNSPVRADSEDALGYYVAGRGALPNWPGFQHRISADDGAVYEVKGSHTNAATMGELVERLPGFPSAYWDDINELAVYMKEGSFASVTDQQMRTYRNGLAIQRPDGTAEYLQFRDAVYEGNYIWRLSGLFRGRLGTDSLTAHSPGAKVVPIEDLEFVTISPDHVGEELLHKALTIGSPAEDAIAYPYTVDPAVTQQELAPTWLELSESGGILTAEWIPRFRLGTELNPVQSVNQTGWRVTVTAGASTLSADTIGPSIAMDVSALAGTATVTVQGINRITGLGLAASGSIAL